MWLMKTSWDFQKKKLEAKNGLYYYPSRCKTKDVYLLRGIFMRGFAFKIDSQIGKLEDPENGPLSWTGAGAWDLSMSLVHHRYGVTSPEGWPREAGSRGDRAACKAHAIGPWVLTSLSEGLFHWIHLGRALQHGTCKTYAIVLWTHPDGFQASCAGVLPNLSLEIGCSLNTYSLTSPHLGLYFQHLFLLDCPPPTCSLAIKILFPPYHPSEMPPHPKAFLNLYLT